jgi:hypothetical protein
MGMRPLQGCSMCNLYSIAKNQEALRRLFAMVRDSAGSPPDTLLWQELAQSCPVTRPLFPLC